MRNERKIRKNPTAAAKTDYNEMWSRAGKPFIDGGVSVVGGQPLSVSFRPALFRLYGFSALQLLYRAVTDQIVVIRGHCTGLEKTPMRRRIKTLYLWSDPHTVKIQIAGKLRNVDEGDIITVYTATGTPVYENEGCQQLSTYLAIDILKGRGSK